MKMKSWCVIRRVVGAYVQGRRLVLAVGGPNA